MEKRLDSAGTDLKFHWHRLSSRRRLEPLEDLQPLSTAMLPVGSLSMAERCRMPVPVDRLRAADLFPGLSAAEAAVLGTFMEPRELSPGEVMVYRGELGDDLFVLAAGQVRVRIRNGAGQSLGVRVLGAGDCFGEIAVLTGGTRIMEVVGVTPAVLLWLSVDAYTRYLAQVVELEQESRSSATSEAGVPG
jgi:Cyclic nucleotide-binding domain